MIQWSTVAPALRSLFGSIALANSVTPEFRAQWQDRKQEFRHPEVQRALILRVTRTRDVLTERKFELSGEEFSEQIYGIREFVLEVRVESFEHAETEGERWAWSMIERLRSALYFERALSALASVGVGLIEVGDSQDVSFKFDKRIVNAALFEARFNAAFCLSDSVPANYFETLIISSQIQGVDGITLDEPPNFTDLVIGEPET